MQLKYIHFIHFQIFHCFGSWLLLGAFPPDEVMKSQLLPILFETLVRQLLNDLPYIPYVDTFFEYQTAVQASLIFCVFI